MIDILYWENVLQLALAAHHDRSRKMIVPGMDSVAFFLTNRRINAYKTICDVLRPVCAMIEKLEGDSYPTMSLVQNLANASEKAATAVLRKEKDKQHPSDTVIAVLKLIIDGVQTRLLYSALNDYDGYIPVDYIAAALDPRTMAMSNLSNTDRELVWSHINKLVEKLKNSSKFSKQNGPDDLAESFGPEFALLLDSPEKPAATRRSRAPVYSAELSDYMLCGGCSMLQNPLEWWKFNEKLYPHLAQLAKEYLAIPASSATVERLFSRAGNVRLYREYV
jgi:hypothetical protein